jgi:hypothetical protein
VAFRANSNPVDWAIRRTGATTNLVFLAEGGNVPMLKSLTLTVAAALVLTMSSGRGDEPTPQADTKDDGIKAEVRGTLRFESGRGYFIAVKAANKTEQEMRVWLWISEDKVLVRKLQGLDGKQVLATGKLAQMPEGRGTSVPPLGMYMSRFEIKEASAR